MINTTNKAIVAFRLSATKEFNNLCNIANQKLPNKDHARELVIDSIIEYYIRNPNITLLNVKRGLTDYVNMNCKNFFLPKAGQRQLEAFEKFLEVAFTDIADSSPPSPLLAGITRERLAIFYLIYFFQLESTLLMNMYRIEEDELYLYYRLGIDFYSQLLVGIALK